MTDCTYYDLLGVPSDASLKELTDAKNFLAKRFHPDSNPDSHFDTTRYMQKVLEAYSILSDPELRREYDARTKTACTEESQGSFSHPSSSSGGYSTHVFPSFFPCWQAADKLNKSVRESTLLMNRQRNIKKTILYKLKNSLSHAEALLSDASGPVAVAGCILAGIFVIYRHHTPLFIAGTILAVCIAIPLCTLLFKALFRLLFLAADFILMPFFVYHRKRKLRLSEIKKKKAYEEQIQILAQQAKSYIQILKKSQIPAKYWYIEAMNWILSEWQKDRYVDYHLIFPLYDEHLAEDESEIDRLKTKEKAMLFQSNLETLLKRL